MNQRRGCILTHVVATSVGIIRKRAKCVGGGGAQRPLKHTPFDDADGFDIQWYNILVGKTALGRLNQFMQDMHMRVASGTRSMNVCSWGARAAARGAASKGTATDPWGEGHGGNGGRGTITSTSDALSKKRLAAKSKSVMMLEGYTHGKIPHLCLFTNIPNYPK